MLFPQKIYLRKHSYLGVGERYLPGHFDSVPTTRVRGLLEKYPTFGREKETGLFGALDT